MPGKETENRNVFSTDGIDNTLSGRLFEIVGPATAKAQPRTLFRREMV